MIFQPFSLVGLTSNKHSIQIWASLITFKVWVIYVAIIEGYDN